MVLEATDVEAINKQTIQRGREWAKMGLSLLIISVNKFRFMVNIVLQVLQRIRGYLLEVTLA